MKRAKTHIDDLIKVVRDGGVVRTGVDIYTDKGILLLDKDVPVSKVNTLVVIKKSGIENLPIDHRQNGGLWDQNGREISFESDKGKKEPEKKQVFTNVEKRLEEIECLKKDSLKKYATAKESIKQVISDIKKTGGEFNHEKVEETVCELFDFLTANESAFSYKTKEIFSYDEYLYNHSINVCTIGTVILKKFNTHFSDIINSYLNNFPIDDVNRQETTKDKSFNYFLPEDQHDIAIGFFLHDLGKVLIPDEILNKKGNLTDNEFDLIKTHSYEKGIEILEKNKIDNPFITNVLKYHHSPLFNAEPNCYPEGKKPIEIPAYVKICKLADIYDAMTSKKSYKEALNPIMAVTEIFRKYAKKEKMLQFMLYSFINAVGIYPPGSLAYLTNGQMCYILDSEGPIILPFTDTHGNTLSKKAEPLEIDETVEDSLYTIDRRRPLVSLIEAYDILPSYLKKI